jgi:selenocysteine lyase/cysteine desulfurase
MAAAGEIYACRKAAASLFGAEPERVIFTLNTTHALNLAIKGLVGRGKEDGGGFHVRCSDMEHNAVYRPL